MKIKQNPSDRIKTGLWIVLLLAFTGCVGYLDGGYVGPVVVPGPDVYFYDGYSERGPDVYRYSHRGHESHESAHHGGGGHSGKR
jgi:hypothetical protein